MHPTRTRAAPADERLHGDDVPRSAAYGPPRSDPLHVTLAEAFASPLCSRHGEPRPLSPFAAAHRPRHRVDARIPAAGRVRPHIARDLPRHLPRDDRRHGGCAPLARDGAREARLRGLHAGHRRMHAPPVLGQGHLPSRERGRRRPLPDHRAGATSALRVHSSLVRGRGERVPRGDLREPRGQRGRVLPALVSLALLPAAQESAHRPRPRERARRLRAEGRARARVRSLRAVEHEARAIRVRREPGHLRHGVHARRLGRVAREMARDRSAAELPRVDPDGRRVGDPQGARAALQARQLRQPLALATDGVRRRSCTPFGSRGATR